MNFYQFYNKLQGKPYEHGSAPNQGNIGSYVDEITTKSKVNDERGNWELTPLEDEDMRTASAEDVLAWQAKHGRNTTRLGEPLDDEGLKRYTGGM